MNKSIDFYKKMQLIRRSEEKLLSLFSSGIVKGTTHLSIGQEACAVGIMEAVKKNVDMVFSNHRGHGHAIAYGLPLDIFFAEMMGLKTGCSKGVGGSQHIHWRNFMSSGIQGGLVPIGVGAAMGEKIKSTGAISVIFIGDGTLGEGVVYESFNYASKWELPVLFVLENNEIAQTTRVCDIFSGNIGKRAECFGIPCDTIDGNNIQLVCDTAKEYCEFIRKKNSPIFLELKTNRLCPHSKSDDHRSRDEIDRLWKYDPIGKLREIIPETEINSIDDEVNLHIESSIKKALSASPLKIDEYMELIQSV